MSPNSTQNGYAHQTIGGTRNDTQTTQYQFLGTGTGRASITPRDPPGAVTIGIVAAKMFGFSSEFGDEQVCRLLMTITVPSLNGSFRVTCPRIILQDQLIQPAIFHPCSGNE